MGESILLGFLRPKGDGSLLRRRHGTRYRTPCPIRPESPLNPLRIAILVSSRQSTSFSNFCTSLLTPNPCLYSNSFAPKAHAYCTKTEQCRHDETASHARPYIQFIGNRGRVFMPCRHDLRPHSEISLFPITGWSRFVFQPCRPGLFAQQAPPPSRRSRQKSSCRDALAQS